MEKQEKKNLGEKMNKTEMMEGLSSKEFSSSMTTMKWMRQEQEEHEDTSVSLELQQNCLKRQTNVDDYFPMASKKIQEKR